MGNKQEDLEAIVQQENYDMVVIMETWWDDSHTGVLQWTAINTSEGVGKGGEVVAQPCMLGVFSLSRA